MTFKLWSGESLWSNIAGILEAKHPPVSVSADARLGTDGAHPASAPPPRHQPRDRNLWQATPLLVNMADNQMANSANWQQLQDYNTQFNIQVG